MIKREMSDAVRLNLQVVNLTRKIAHGERVITFVQAEWNNTSMQLENAALDIERLKETVEGQAREIQRLKAANERLETTLCAASKRMSNALSATNK